MAKTTSYMRQYRAKKKGIQAPKIQTNLEHITSIVDEEISQFNGIPEWFLFDNLTQHERYAWQTGDGPYIAKETEKAVLYKNKTDFGTVKLWVPKSLIGKVSESERKQEINFKIGGAYNEYLRGLAKEKGVKLGSTKKTVKVIEKLEGAGITVPTKDEFVNMPFQG